MGVAIIDLVRPRGFVKERVAAFAEAGATTLILHPPTTDPDEYLRYVEELIRHYRGTARRGVPNASFLPPEVRRSAGWW